jgi:uncharacterized protein (UPF0332 family)
VNEQAISLWERALKSLESAENLLAGDPDGSSSRAYYSAFYAVSAFFAIQGKSFSKHSAVESAVHRDLVKAGVWSVELGEYYSYLRGTRARGDYGGIEHVSRKDAEKALKAAERILKAVHEAHPDIFTYPEK